MGATSKKIDYKKIWIAFQDSSSQDKWDQYEADEKDLLSQLSFLTFQFSSHRGTDWFAERKCAELCKFHLQYSDIYSAFIEKSGQQTDLLKDKYHTDRQ